MDLVHSLLRNRDAFVASFPKTLIAYPTRPVGIERCVLRCLGRQALIARLVVTTLAHPTRTIGVERCVLWYPDRLTLIARSVETTIALPAVAEIVQWPFCGTSPLIEFIES